MAKTMSVSLGDHFTGFVKRQVEQGRYGSVSEAVRAGLRLLEEREAKVKALQTVQELTLLIKRAEGNRRDKIEEAKKALFEEFRILIAEEEESGPPAPFDNEAFPEADARKAWEQKTQRMDAASRLKD